MSERLSPAELERRQNKREFRQSVSIEHGKTRAAVVAAHQRINALQSRLGWLQLVIAVEVLAIVGLIYVVVR